MVARTGATPTLAQTGSENFGGNVALSLGAVSTDGEFKLVGNVGQTPGSEMSGSGYLLEIGFLASTSTGSSVYLPLAVR